MPGNDLLDQALAIGVVPALTGCAMANEDITDSEDRDLLARLVFILAMGPEDAPALLAWADIDEGEGVPIILAQGTADGERLSEVAAQLLTKCRLVEMLGVIWCRLGRSSHESACS